MSLQVLFLHRDGVVVVVTISHTDCVLSILFPIGGVDQGPCRGDVVQEGLKVGYQDWGRDAARGEGRIAGQRTTQREVDVHGRFADPLCVGHHLHTPAPQVVEDLRPGGVAGEADPFHLNELAFLLRLPDFYT